MSSQLETMSETSGYLYRDEAEDGERITSSVETTEQSQSDRNGKWVVIVHGPEWDILVDGSDIFEPPASNVINYAYDHSVFLNSNPGDATLETGRELLGRLEEAITDDSPGDYEKSHIIFIADTWGACIVKKALLIADRDGTYQDISLNTQLLVFFACPHRAIDTAHWRCLASKMIEATEPIHDGARNADLTQRIAFLFSDTAEAFHKLARRYRMINVFQERNASGDYPIVIDRWAATLEVGNETRLGRSVEHDALGVFALEDASWSELQRNMDMTTAHMANEVFSHNTHDICKQSTLLQDDGASLVKERRGIDLGDILERISKTDEFCSWGSSSSNNILMLRCKVCPTLENLRSLVDRQRELYWDIDGGRSIQLSFRFRSDDGYGSDLAELATSFIMQYPVRTGSKEELLQPMPELLWTERRLWTAFRSLLCRAPPHRLIVLLGSFEKCKQSDRWFLQDLAGLASNAEWRLKIICTIHGSTGATEVIKEAKIKEHHIDLGEMTQEHDKLHGAAHDMLEKFLLTNTLYKAIKTQLIEKLGDPAPEKLTGMLILLRYLESADIPTTREQMLDELESFSTINPTDVTRTILKKVPAARRPWARRILTWIACGCRPLTASELAVASALDRKIPQSCALENTVYNDIKVDISRSPLGSVLEFDCGQIRFVDNHVVDVITDKADRNWYTLPSNPDWMLCLTCVSYLRVNGVRNASQHLHYIEPRGIFTFPADKEYLGLLEYAVKYWPVHYRRATLAGGTDDNAIINFFQDIEAIQSWSELHWYLQSGFHKQWQGLDSLTRLQLSAFLGVPVAIRQLKQQTDSKELESAVATAARKGNEDLVDLVGSMKTRGNVFETALVDAAHTGNGAILMKLLRYSDESSPCSTMRDLAAVHMKTLLYLSSEYGLTECLGHLVKLCKKQNILIDSEQDRQKLLLSAAANGQDKFVRQLFQDLFPKGVNGGYGGDWSYTPLHAATAGGHAGIVEYIRNRSGYVEAKGRQSEETALHVAARAGFTNIADKLLRYKSKIDAPDARGRIPLHLACMNGFKFTSKRLMSTQHIPDHEGNTAIHHAARGGHMGVINLFRHKKDLLVKRNKKSENPLHIALKENNEVASRCFVKAYQAAQDIGTENNSIKVGDFNEEDENGDTPLTLALRKGFENLGLDIIRLDWQFKQRRVIMDSKHEDQIMVAFEVAAECGYTTVMEELLQRHRKVCTYKKCIEQAVKAAAKNGRSHTLSFLLGLFDGAKEGCGRKLQEEAFLNAASSGDLGIVRVLLDHGVDVNIQDEYNNTALGLAAFYRRADVARLLLLRKADTQKSDCNGETPLSDAASEDSCDIAELLLDAGACVDAQNKRRETPLVRAIRSGNTKIVKLLLEAGADMDIADNEGDNALCHAVRLSDIRILDLLLDRRPGIEALQGAAYLALEQGKTEIMRALLMHVPEVFFENWKQHRWSPLQAAAYWGQLDIVDLLLEFGADVNGTGGQFYTALQAAAYGDRTAGGKLTTKLLCAGARTDLHGGTFGTALHAAASRPDKEEHSPKYTIALMLMNRDKGLRDCCDSQGRLPLHLAAYCNDWEMMMMMLVKPVDRNLLLLEDRLGRTPLHFAAASGRSHVIQQILDVCAKANDDPRDQTDCDGWTPLHWACRAGSETAINFLMRDPHDLIREADEGCTPVSIACSHGHAKTMATVLEKELPEEVSQINYDAKEYHEGYSCNSCLCNIYGVRYQCTTCIECDFCSKCYRRRERIHERHSFRHIDLPAED